MKGYKIFDGDYTVKSGEILREGFRKELDTTHNIYGFAFFKSINDIMEYIDEEEKIVEIEAFGDIRVGEDILYANTICIKREISFEDVVMIERVSVGIGSNSIETEYRFVTREELCDFL